MPKVAVITGASRGIGAATAKLLAVQGFDVCVNYLSNSVAAQAVVAEIEAVGGRAIAMQADVSNEKQVEHLFTKVELELGSPYALINNAGILFQQARLSELSAERINRIFAVNVTGSFLCSKYAAKAMSTRTGGAGGVIVNVSSVAARLGAAGEYVDYAASKGALDTMTIGLAKELADDGIRVNAVRPGYIYTTMHADGGEPARVERLKSSVPMQRGGEPQEVAAAIAWLVSEQSSYSAGTFIEVAGGR